MDLKIKDIRIKKNVSQDALAAKTGISKRMLIDYEKEIKDVPLRKLQLIASALEVTIFDLINLDSSSSFIDESMDLPNQDLLTVSEETQNFLINTIIEEKNIVIKQLQQQIAGQVAVIEDLKQDKKELLSIIKKFKV